MRKWVANRLLGLATWALPANHPAIAVIYDAAWTIDDQEWPVKRDKSNYAAWFSLVMNAAAELESAANCLGDSDAKQAAHGAAKHYRDAANALWLKAVPNAVIEGRRSRPARMES